MIAIGQSSSHGAGIADPFGDRVLVGRRLLLAELFLVLGLSLGRSGIYALVDLIAAATARGTLSSHRAVLNAGLAPGRAWLDLGLQLLSLGFGLVPVLLVAYLLLRSGTSPSALWFGRARRRATSLGGSPSHASWARPVSPSIC